jgi:hypothetical protein
VDTTLNQYNDIIKNNQTPDLFDILKKITKDSEPANYRNRIKLLFIALCYQELINIPIKANYYVNKATQEGAT